MGLLVFFYPLYIQGKINPFLPLRLYNCAFEELVSPSVCGVLCVVGQICCVMLQLIYKPDYNVKAGM